MNNESLVNNLYKFIKSDVSIEKMNEANLKAYPETEVQKLNEGKLPDDPSEIKDPEGDIQKLSEKNKKITEENEVLYKKIKGSHPDLIQGLLKCETCGKEKKVDSADALKNGWPKCCGYTMKLQSTKNNESTQKKEEKEADAAVNKDIKTANAGKTEEPEETNLQKEAAKETPVDKLTQNKDGKDPLDEDDKVKEEKKITPEVTGVEKTKESKLPSDNGKDNSIIDNPEEQIQMLSEEKCLTTVSDEKVAKDISSKYPGSRVVKDDQGKQFMVMIKEQKINELTGAPVYLRDLKAELQSSYSEEVKELNPEGDKDIIVGYYITPVKLEESKEKVKEDVDVTVKTEGEEIKVVSTPDGIQATKVNPEVQPIDRVETEVEVAEEEPDFYPEEKEMNDEEVEEMAEKITVADYLETLSKLTEKQKKFKDEVKSKKIGKKNKAKIAAKVKKEKK